MIACLGTIPPTFMMSRGNRALGGWLVAFALALAGCARTRDAGSIRERIDHGWDRYRLGEYADARRVFQAALDTAAPGSDERLHALYGLATAWGLQRTDADDEKAVSLYLQVIALAPTNDLAAWSWLAIARIRSLPVDGEPPPLQPQLAAYQDCIRRFPFHPAGEEALLFHQAARLQKPDTNAAQRVLAELEAFLRDHPQSPWRSAACRLADHCSALLGQGERRLAFALEERRTAEIDPTNPVQDLSLAYWRIATLAEFEAGDFATAREYYRRLIAEYPQQQHVFLAKQELKRMDELEAAIRREAGAR